MTRPAVGIVAACLLCTIALIPSPAHARPGIVKTRDGHTYEGDVDQKPNQVTISTRGIKTDVPANDVVSVVFSDEYEQQFNQRLAKLPPNDVPGRLTLAREAFNNRKYVLARDVAEQALTIDPNSADAYQLRELIMSQIRLERAKNQAPASGVATTSPTAHTSATTTASTEPSNDKRFIKVADINRIRQVEIGRNEVVPVRFERDVLRRYGNRMSHRRPEEFFSLTAMQQAQEILENGAPEMRDDVRFTRDPLALLDFKRVIQPYVLQNCATSVCHGGPTAKQLVLFNPAPSDQVMYTNFYILSQWSKTVPTATGVFSKGRVKMIDRAQPARSLLLQYSIPQRLSDYDHPDVQGYRPPLRGIDDPKYVQNLAWIRDELNPIETDYGIRYAIPGMPSTHPATTTSTGPTSRPPDELPHAPRPVR